MTEAELRADHSRLLLEREAAAVRLQDTLRVALVDLTRDVNDIKIATGTLRQHLLDFRELASRVKIIEDFKIKACAVMFAAFTGIGALWKVIDRIL